MMPRSPQKTTMKAAPRGTRSPSPTRTPGALSLSGSSAHKLPPHSLHGVPSPENRFSGFAKSPTRNFTKSPTRNFTKSPTRNFAKSPTKSFPRSPQRSYIKSPTRLSAVKQQKDTTPVDRLPIGSAVERNPAFWKYGDQDGGEGSIGIVTADDPTNGYVCVLWSGNVTRNYYKYGLQAEYDVMRSTRYDIMGYLYFNTPVSSFTDPGALGDCIRCDISEYFSIPLAMTTISFLSTHEHNIVGVKFVLKRDSDKHDLQGLSDFVPAKTLLLDRSLQINLDKSYIKNGSEVYSNNATPAPVPTPVPAPAPAPAPVAPAPVAKPRFSVPANRQINNFSNNQVACMPTPLKVEPTVPTDLVELAPMVTRIDVISRVSPSPRLYQLTLRGDISQMPVAAIKKSLEAHTGVPSSAQVLEKEGYVLYDNATGSAAGLKSGSVLTLRLGNEGSTPTKSYYVSEAAQVYTNPNSPTTWTVNGERRSVSPPRR